MLNISLFLGIPLIPIYVKALEAIDPQTLALFVSDREDSYLKEVVFEENRYLGKFLGESILISELAHLEKNIYSILNKMLPEQTFSLTPLVVFAIPAKST